MIGLLGRPDVLAPDAGVDGPQKRFVEADLGDCQGLTLIRVSGISTMEAKSKSYQGSWVSEKQR